MNSTNLNEQSLTLDKAELRDFTMHGWKLPDKQDPEKGYNVVFNTGTGKIASVVSKKYNLVQHGHVVRSVSEAISNLNIPYEYRLQSSSNRIFLDISFPTEKIHIQTGEEFITGLRVINSYDRTTGILVLPRLTRQVCSNGMIVSSFVKGYTITHAQKLAEDFAGTIQVMLKDMINKNEKLKAMINDCIGDSIEWQLMDKIVAKLVKGVEKHKIAIAKILEQNVKDGKVTRWDLYNAFTDYATHGRQIRPSVEQALQVKAQKILKKKLVALVPQVA